MSLGDFMGRRIRSWVGTTFASLIFCGAFLLSVTGVLASQDALGRAHRKLDSGNVREAIAELENYRQAHPAEADVYNLLGIAYARAGDDGRSLDMFKVFARRAPSLPQAYNNLGAAYLRKEDTERAETAFRHALRLSPQDVNALYNLGALLNARHKYAESRPLLDRALRREHSPQIAYEAAIADAGVGARQDALRILNSMSPPPGVNAVPWLRLAGTLNFDEGNIDAASKALEEATRLAPDDEQSLYALALVRLKQHQSDQAIPLLNTALSSIPPESRLVREGTLLANYGAYDQALAKFEQATRLDPSSYDALYNLAVLRLEHFKDANGALDAAQSALAVKTTGEIHDVLGDICEAQSHYIDALNHYQQAVRLDPNSDKFAFDLGADLLLHENYDAARTVFHAAEDRFPKASRIYLGLGTSEFMRGKTADAVGAFLKAVDLDPQFEPAYVFLGEAFSFSDSRSTEVATRLEYLAEKKPASFELQYYYGAALVKEMEDGGGRAKAARALASLRRAAALRPTDARVYFHLGEFFRVQQNLTEAAQNYEKAISLDGNFPEPLYKLGQTYTRMGKQKEAKEIFARHREVVSKQAIDLDRRAGEIQSFVLKIRGIQ